MNVNGTAMILLGKYFHQYIVSAIQKHRWERRRGQ